MTPTPLQRSAALELLRQEEALESLSKFREYIAPTGQNDFRNVPALHHELILDHLQRLEYGAIQRLLILAPPGSAKSTYCSIQYPLWRLARAPATNVLCASNTMTLAEEFNRRRRAVVLTPEWRRLSETGPALVREGVDHFVTDKQGGVRAAGVGSAIVGFRSHLNVLAMLLQQLQQARALQDTPEPQGRGQGYGKLYTAPSPLEIVGNNLLKYMGYQKAGDVAAQQRALMGQQTQGRGLYFDLLRRALLAQAGGDPTASGGDYGTPEGGDL